MRQMWLTMAAAVMLSGCGDDSAPRMDGGGGTDAGARADSGTGTDGAAATDGGAATDGATATDGGFDGTLTNAPATCAMSGYTFADAANTGHYAAARLTPPRFPFTVTSVFYTLIHDPDTCDADQAHSVMVFTSTSPTPPGAPAGVTLSVAAPATPTVPGTSRLIEATLDTPVVVDAGEELFVAVQMLRTGDPVCIEECLDPGTADRNWWSAAPASPFPWRTLSSYGNDGTLTIGVHGD